MAVLLGVRDDDELERLLLVHSKKLRPILDAADQRIQEGAGIDHDQFWREVETTDRKREANDGKKKGLAKRPG